MGQDRWFFAAPPKKDIAFISLHPRDLEQLGDRSKEAGSPPPHSILHLENAGLKYAARIGYGKFSALTCAKWHGSYPGGKYPQWLVPKAL